MFFWLREIRKGRKGEESSCVRSGIGWQVKSWKSISLPELKLILFYGKIKEIESHYIKLGIMGNNSWYLWDWIKQTKVIFIYKPHFLNTHLKTHFHENISKFIKQQKFFNMLHTALNAKKKSFQILQNFTFINTKAKVQN